MHVIAAWELVEVKGVHLRTSGCDVSKLSLSRLLFTPTPMDGAAAWRLQDGHAVSDVIAQRPVHEVQCLFVPDCLVDLLLSGDVSSLILLARWYGSSARRADQRIRRLFPDWPAQEWIRDAVATCRLAVTGASVKPLSSATLEELAGQIRSWAPEALAGLGNDAVVFRRRKQMGDAAGWLEACAKRLRGEHSLAERAVLGKLKFSAEVLLSTLRASRLLRSGSRLHHMLQVGINARYPGLFDLSVDTGVKMSASNNARSMLSVHAALLLLARAWQGEDRYYRFAWSDGTDLKGRQLLMSRHMQIPCDKIVEAMQVAHKLAWDRRHSARQLRAERQRAQRLELGLDEDGSEEEEEEVCLDVCNYQKCKERDGPELPALSAEERQRLCTFLMELIVPHVFVPISLGLGHTDLASKVEASVYSFMWECASMQDLRNMCSSYRTYTTDMGTEMGIAQFHGRLSRLLPPWSGSLPRFTPIRYERFDIQSCLVSRFLRKQVLRKQVSAAMQSFGSVFGG